MKQIVLDDTRQRELYEKACAAMARLLPGWSDALPSDPAVAILELASYLSDAQNHELDQVREEHYLAYLKLLGGRPRQLTPARIPARAAVSGGLFPGMRFSIDSVPFEVVDGWRHGDNQIAAVILEQDGRRTTLREDTFLGISGQGEAELYITFQRPLAAGNEVRLWLGLQEEPGRMPPEEDTPPPVLLRAWFLIREQWTEAPCRDGTCGLLRSGWVSIQPPAAADTLKLCVEGGIEGEPLLSAVVLEPVWLEQRRTWSRCFDLTGPFQIPEGWAQKRSLRFFHPERDGWRESGEFYVQEGRIHCSAGTMPPALRVVAAEPDFPAVHTLRPLAMEKVYLDVEGVLPQSLRLMVEENGLWYDCPVRQPETGRTLPRGCRWDAARNTLRFGDGRDFRVPQAGRLLIAECASTMGSGGNGAGGPLEREGVRLLPLRPAAGGQDAESAKDAFYRVAREQEQPLRAVTCQDYEILARRTPGLALDRVRAVTNRELGKAGAGIVLLAKPRSKQPEPTLTRWQRVRLLEWIERFRLIGVPVTVRGPRYCPIEVRVAVSSAGLPSAEALRTAALGLTDGVTGPLDFGAELSYTALFAALSAVPGVREVRALEVRALSGGGRPTQEGGVCLETDVLPRLERFQVTEV